jgi:hypothetical protein
VVRASTYEFMQNPIPTSPSLSGLQTYQPFLISALLHTQFLECSSLLTHIFQVIAEMSLSLRYVSQSGSLGRLHFPAVGSKQISQTLPTTVCLLYILILYLRFYLGKNDAGAGGRVNIGNIGLGQ